MGNSTSTRKVNFEDVQHSMKNKNKFLLINTLDGSRQNILIKNTVPVDKEEELINKLIKSNLNVNIIVYDENANAPNLMKKYDQLVSLGFINLYILVDYLNGFYFKIFMVLIIFLLLHRKEIY